MTLQLGRLKAPQSSRPASKRWTEFARKEIDDMSDLRRIIADKQVTRGQATPEQRQLNALEEISDSLEGIRQDLTALNLLVGDIGKTLARGKP
jgi:hypothetical protein